MSRDGYGSDSDDSDSDDSETGGGGWDKSEVKRKRILDQFIESEFRKRRKVHNSVLHYYLYISCGYIFRFPVQQKKWNNQVSMPLTSAWCVESILDHDQVQTVG